MAKYMKTEDGYQEIEAVNSNKMNINNPVGSGSFSMGRKPGSVIGDFSHTEGYETTASNFSSHAEGFGASATGESSHAEGQQTTASGYGSHAEGLGTTASDGGSHTEGSYTTASGYCSHAEGQQTTASGYGSHAEGSGAIASGSRSHAEGEWTIAKSSNQHVQGKYNVEDSQDKYAHIVGNGKNEATRSNSYTLTWSGIPWYQGRPQFGGTAMDNGSQTVMANGDKEIILTSSTPDSTKKFKITVDDSGAISATEVT